MHRLFKKTLSILFISLIIFTCSTTAFAATSGFCGTNTTWSFDETSGMLTVSGTGPTTNYTNQTFVPWRRYKDQITGITIEQGITEIGNYLFNGCEKVSQIIIPDSVTVIGYSSFDNCTSLESITIPASVTEISNAPFYNCISLKSITVDPDNKSFASDESGTLYNIAKTNLIQYPAGRTDANFAVPDTIETLSFGAFANCKYLFNVILPDSVTKIDSMCFVGCFSLEVITLSKNLTMIGEMAFSECLNLKDVYYTGTQNDWNQISVRSDNNYLTNAVFHYTEKGPEIVKGKPIEDIVINTDKEKTDEEKAETARKFVIPLVIGIAVLIIIFVSILIYVIFKKKPDKE